MLSEASFLDKTMISSYIFLLVVCVGTFFLTFIKQGVIHKSRGIFFVILAPPPPPAVPFITSFSIYGLFSKMSKTPIPGHIICE